MVSDSLDRPGRVFARQVLTGFTSNLGVGWLVGGRPQGGSSGT